MKVLLVLDDFLPGGISRHVVDLANGLFQKGNSITVAATDGAFRQYLNSNIQFIPLRLLKKDSFGKRIFGILPSFLILKKLIQNGHFDIIHSHKRFSHFLISLISRDSSIHITSYHNVFPGKEIFSVFGDYTVCCSKAVLEMVSSQYQIPPEQTAIVYNGREPFDIHNHIRQRETFYKLNINASKTVVSSVGQFIPSKDRETLIHSIQILRDENRIENVVFVLLGYGYLQHKLERLVRSLELEQYITFTDNHCSVEELFNISEFMILNPKHSEGFGIVMLEGASLGKVHIGTTIGGIPEFIEHNKTGLLVPPQDPTALSQAIMKLLENPSDRRRMGENTKREYEMKYRSERMVTEMLTIYQSIGR